VCAALTQGQVSAVLKTRLRAVALAGVLAVATSVGAGKADTLTLSPDEALLTAQAAFQAGEFAIANHIAKALLLVDPKDPLVLLILAATEPKLGNADAGLSAGRLAWSEAKRRDAPDGLRWEIARNTAKAAYEADRLGLAQWWLRRSLDVAPDDQSKARSVADLRDVQAQNRLHWKFGLTIGPTDNLNGGASDPVFRIDDTVIGTLGEGSEAVGGMRARLTFGAKYALAPQAGGQTVLGVSGGVLLNRIDPDDAMRAGDLQSSDLNETTLAFSLRRDMPEALAGLPLSLELRVSGTWGGGDWIGPTLGATAVFPLQQGETTSLWLALDAERRWTEGVADPQDVLRLTGFGEVAVLGDQRLSYALTAERALSERRNGSYEAISLSVGYDPGWQLGPADIDLSLQLARRHYETFSLGFARVTQGRTDSSWGLGLDLSMPEWDVMGFAPVVSIDIGRTSSNVSRYETETRGVTFGFEQVF
jgi:hypothetical protein